MIRAQAELIARWLLVGFVHGVMNTDNMSVAGETIDYGPCAFLDEYDPGAVFSAIDSYGRYAYANQPAIAQWNLTRLAECLLPLLADDDGRRGRGCRPRRWRRSPRRSNGPTRAACGASSASPPNAKGTPRWRRICCWRWRRTARTSPSPSAG